jgi:hypothetical protein
LTSDVVSSGSGVRSSDRSRVRGRLAIGARWAFLIAVAAVAAEAASYVAIAATRDLLIEPIRPTGEIFRDQTAQIRNLLAGRDARLLMFDSTLGWRYRPSYHDQHNAINAQGLRASRRYPPSPGRCITRVAAFGDSFVYGTEVDDGATWADATGRMFPGVEVLNYGVGGYGVDQAYLRYVAEGADLAPAVVLIGFHPNDLGRVVNVYRRFLSIRELPLVKPRFELRPDGELELLPAPLHRIADYEQYLRSPADIIQLGRHDYWYEPAIYESAAYDRSVTYRLVSGLWIRLKRRYLDPDRLFRGSMFNEASEAFRIQLAVFRRFTRAVTARGAVPLIVIFPDRDALLAVHRGEPRAYAPLIARLEAEGLHPLDLAAGFFAPGVPFQPEGWFMPGGHYSPTANRIVAQWLGSYLAARFSRCSPPRRQEVHQ